MGVLTSTTTGVSPQVGIAAAAGQVQGLGMGGRGRRREQERETGDRRDDPGASGGHRFALLVS